MNNQKVALIAVLVLFVFGIGVYLFSSVPSDRQMVAEPTPILEDSTVVGSNMEADPSVGENMTTISEDTFTSTIIDVTPKAETGGELRYEEYSPDVLTSSADKRRVLFFYANWCPTCKPADEDFTKNSSKIPTDVQLIKVNYNDTETDQVEKDLAKQYGVTYQHTFVQIDASGKVVAKWNGGQTTELIANLK